MVTETSKMAYDSTFKERQTQREIIFNCLRDVLEVANDRTISEYTGIEKNAVCGRRNELMNMGLIYCAGMEEDKLTKKMCYVWRVKQSMDIENIEDK